MDDLNIQFLHLVRQIQNNYVKYDRITQLRVEKWVMKLSEESGNLVFAKNRNDHASALLKMVNNGEFEWPFTKSPTDAPLGNLPIQLKLSLPRSTRATAKPTRCVKRPVWKVLLRKGDIHNSDAAAEVDISPSHDLYSAVRQRSMSADRRTSRHSGCFHTSDAGCTGMASCKCHCNLHKQSTEPPRGTLAQFFTHPSAVRPSAESHDHIISQTSMPSWDATSGARKVSVNRKSNVEVSERKGRSRASSSTSMRSRSHESVLDRPPRSRAGRIARRLMARMGAKPAEQATPEPREISPQAASARVCERAVQNVVDRIELAAARKEAVYARSEAAAVKYSEKDLQVRNGILRSALSSMTEHVKGLHARSVERHSGFPSCEMSVPPAVWCHAQSTAINDENTPTDTKTNSRTDAVTKLTSSSMKRIERQTQTIIQKAPLATDTTTKADNTLTPKVARSRSNIQPQSKRSVHLEVTGGDEIDLECARYGPRLAGKISSPTREEVSPLSQRVSTLLPAFRKLDKLPRHDYEDEQSILTEDSSWAGQLNAADEIEANAKIAKQTQLPVRPTRTVRMPRLSLASIPFPISHVVTSSDNSSNPSWNVPIAPLVTLQMPAAPTAGR